MVLCAQGVVEFNTEEGDSDSLMDARRAFLDIWHEVERLKSPKRIVRAAIFLSMSFQHCSFDQVKSSENKEGLVQLWENGHLKEEKCAADLVPKSKTGKTKKDASAEKDKKEPKAKSAKAPKVRVEDDDGDANGAAEGEIAPKAGGSRKKTSGFVDSEGGEIPPARNAYGVFCAERRPGIVAELEVLL